MRELLRLAGSWEVTWSGPEAHTIPKLSQVKSFLSPLSPRQAGEGGGSGANRRP